MHLAPIMLAIVTGCAATPAISDTAALTELAGEFQAISELNDAGEVGSIYGLVNEEHEWVLLEIEGIRAPASGTRVELRGQWLDPYSFSVQSIEQQPGYKGLFTDPPARTTPMHHNVIVMVATDVAQTEAQRDSYRTQIQDTMDEVSHFFESVTHGVDTFELGLGGGDGIYFSDVTATGSPGCRYGDSRLIDEMREAFVSQPHASKSRSMLEAELEEYEHTIAILPPECLNGMSGWAIRGGVDQDGQLSFTEVSVISSDKIRNDVLAHELAHNLSLGHAWSYECDNYFESYLQGCDYIFGYWRYSEYGNLNDIMGKGVDTWFMTPSMRRLGWLPTERVETPLGAGTREFELTPMDSGQLNGTQALRIPVHGEDYTTFFYLEYRRPSANAYSGVQVGDTRQPAVLLTYANDVSGVNSRLELDTGRNLGLAVGRSYTIGSGEHEVGITVLSMEETARVALTTKEAPERDPLCADGVSHPDRSQTEAWREAGRERPPECGCPDPNGGVCLMHVNAGIDDAGEHEIEIGYSGVTRDNVPDYFPDNFPDDDVFSEFFFGIYNPYSLSPPNSEDGTRVAIRRQANATSVSSVSFPRLPEGHYHVVLRARWFETLENGYDFHTVDLQSLRISVGEPDPHFVRTGEGDPTVDLPYQEVIAQAFTLQTLEALLVATRISNEVPSTGITLFAPWNLAFEAAPSYWSRIKDGLWYGHLRDFVLGHVHAGELFNAELTDGRAVAMMNGQTGVVSRASGGLPELDGVSVIGSLVTTNANLHLTDAVLTPAWTEHTMMDVLEADGRFTSLTQILASPAMEDYRDALSDLDSGLTLFAPTDSALAGIGEGCGGDDACVEAVVGEILDAQMGDEGQGVRSRHDPGSRTLRTVVGTTLRWNPDPDEPTVGCEGVSDPEQQTPVREEVYANNGIVQPVDSLLLACP